MTPLQQIFYEKVSNIFARPCFQTVLIENSLEKITCHLAILLRFGLNICTCQNFIFFSEFCKVRKFQKFIFIIISSSTCVTIKPYSIFLSRGNIQDFITGHFTINLSIWERNPHIKGIYSSRFSFQQQHFIINFLVCI
jgi:hypothetical protein